LETTPQDPAPTLPDGGEGGAPPAAEPASPPAAEPLTEASEELCVACPHSKRRFGVD
jgi:hypothetical protein